jgi:hypothetical protein
VAGSTSTKAKGVVMRWKKASPGGEEKPRVEQFSYTRTQPGLKGVWYAWAAHEPHWFECHEHKDTGKKEDWGTKVCLDWFTDGALACPRCKPGAKIAKCAYCPVWAEADTAPCMVIVHDRTADLMGGIEFGRYVMISCVDRKRGVTIQCAAEQRRFRSDLPYRQCACDIGVSLLTLWAYPQLATWLKTPEAPKQERKTEQPVKKKPGTGHPMYAAAHRKVDAAVNGTSTTDDALDRLLRRATANPPSTNGEHKPTSG